MVKSWVVRASIIAIVSCAKTAAAQTAQVWVPSWTAAQTQLEDDVALPDDQMTDVTLRQAVRLSIGGARIRIVLSNEAGTRPLAIAGVEVARSGRIGSADIAVQSNHVVLFQGRPGLTIPAGEQAISDPVDLPVAALARLSISMHFATPSAPQTGHMRALSSTWIVPGDQLGATSLIAAKEVQHWYQIAAVQVDSPDAKLIVAFGDSITDGSGSTANADNRWPDLLAERLQAFPALRNWAVVNQGIAGNRLLSGGYGRSGLARFAHDVLTQPHAHTLIVLEGTNDLGQLGSATQQPASHRALVAQIIKAYEQLVVAAHAHRLRILGATLLPYGGSDYHPTALDDAGRHAINDWIRTSGRFDAVIDWNAIMRDPRDPERLRPEFDSGDHAHPSPVGYRAMVNAISIAELTK